MVVAQRAHRVAQCREAFGSDHVDDVRTQECFVADDRRVDDGRAFVGERDPGDPAIGRAGLARDESVAFETVGEFGEPTARERHVGGELGGRERGTRCTPQAQQYFEPGRGQVVARLGVVVHRPHRRGEPFHDEPPLGDQVEFVGHEPRIPRIFSEDILTERYFRARMLP